MRAQVVGAFVATGAAALLALMAGVVLTAGLSSDMSARQAGDALVWMGVLQLLAVVGFVAGFRWLARRWSGVSPPWWSLPLLGVMVLAVAAVLFFLAMIMMNR
jgi:hypothetical protein